jgi:hypothetical protein
MIAKISVQGTSRKPKEYQLGYKFQKMTKQNGLLNGLKDQECERGNCTKRPPIPYIPVVDEVQDTINANSREPRTQKIKLPNKTEFQACVWNSGTPEEFLSHVKQAIHACDCTGLFLCCSLLGRPGEMALQAMFTASY